jgi:DNA polymerase (family 10)
VLAELEVVVASLHVPANDEAENTRRLIRAAQNPYVHMLGHPSGRLLLERDAYPVDLPAVIDACADTGTWIELNASPYRLDLDWRLWRYARTRASAASSTATPTASSTPASCASAPAWPEKAGWHPDDVINTLPLPALRKQLQAKRLKQ